MAPPTTFLPLNTKTDGQARYVKDREAICLMEVQAKHTYKKVETEDIVNVDTIKQKIEVEKLNQIDDTKSKTNPYHEIITNKGRKRQYKYITDGTVVNSQ